MLLDLDAGTSWERCAHAHARALCPLMHLKALVYNQTFLPKSLCRPSWAPLAFYLLILTTLLQRSLPPHPPQCRRLLESWKKTLSHTFPGSLWSRVWASWSWQYWAPPQVVWDVSATRSNFWLLANDLDTDLIGYCSHCLPGRNLMLSRQLTHAENKGTRVEERTMESVQFTKVKH